MSTCIVCKTHYLKSNFKKYCSKECYFIRNKSVLSGSIISPCLFCSKEVLKSKSELNNNNIFCNNSCSTSYFRKDSVPNPPMIELICKRCNKSFSRIRWTSYTSGVKRFTNDFCSIECNAKYLGSQSKNFERSSLELYIHRKLEINFPFLKFIASDRDQLFGLELDFFFPDLNLGIEINGPMHYNPHFGEEYLLSVQKRDLRKIELCKNKNIDLLIIKSISKFTITQAESFWRTEIKSKLMSLIPFCEPYIEEEINFVKPIRKQIGKYKSDKSSENIIKTLYNKKKDLAN